MLGTCLENVRNTVPLVHNITNYVTVNDVANILLACGGSPIMSDEPLFSRCCLSCLYPRLVTLMVLKQTLGLKISCAYFYTD